MPIDDERLYEEISRAWHRFVAWREKIFAGYLAVLAALAIGFSQYTSIPVRAAIFAGAILVSVVFWIFDFRTAQLVNACQVAGDRLDRSKGCYAELNQLRFSQKNGLTYGLAINLMVAGVVGASVGGISSHMLRWLCDGFSLWLFIIAFAFAAFATTLAILRKLANKQWLTEEARYRKNGPDPNGRKGLSGQA